MNSETMIVQSIFDDPQLDDLGLSHRIAMRDAVAVRLVTQHNNRRLFRVALSILKDRPESEDAVQSAYLKGFSAITQFRGESSLSTWLTRILINEALERRRKRVRELAQSEGSVIMIDEYRDRLAGGSRVNSPDESLALLQMRRILEQAIGRLPDDFRLVFVLREIEGFSVEDAANLLGVVPATIKTRHLRVRRRLQTELGPEMRAALDGSFPFAGMACETMTAGVVARFCSVGEP